MSKFSEIKIYKNKNGTSNFLANGTFLYDGVLKVNFQVIKGPSGPFVALPQTKYEKDGKIEYKKEVSLIDSGVIKELNTLVLKELNGETSAVVSTATNGSHGRSTSVSSEDLPF